MVPQTGEVYKPARPGPAGDLNNSLRLTLQLVGWGQGYVVRMGSCRTKLIGIGLTV